MLMRTRDVAPSLSPRKLYPAHGDSLTHGSGTLIQISPHRDVINDIQLSADGTHFVTASKDNFGKLFDVYTLMELKVSYATPSSHSLSLSHTHERTTTNLHLFLTFHSTDSLMC